MRKAVVDPRIDVWGLGATLYTLLTGQSPYPLGLGNIAKVLTDDYTRPRNREPNLHPDLEAVVCKCLCKKPDGRYATAAELGDDLGRWRRGEPTVARPRTRLETVQAKVAKVPRSTMFVLGLAVAALFLATALAFRSPRTPHNPPQSTREERDQAELKAGRPVTLIGEEHDETRTWRTYLEPNRLIEPGIGVEGSALTAHRYCLCELMSNPGIPRYRISAQLQCRQEKLPKNGGVANASSTIGLYFGHSVRLVPTKYPVHTLFGITTWDADRDAVMAGKPVKAWLRFQRAFLTDAPLGEKGYFFAKRWEQPYPPSATLPGLWRTLEVEVAPEGIRVWWYGPERGQPFVEWDRSLVDSEYAANIRALVDQLPTSAGLYPEWSPEMGFGLLATDAILGVKNVTVTPLLEKDTKRE